MNDRRPSLLVIFLTVFLDLVGFGIVLPLLPRYGERFGAEGFMIGLIISVFSILQFLLGPWWGQLADRIGRRPVLLVSNAGSAVSYALFALSVWPGLAPKLGLGILLFSRAFAGACGANISVASAYIADVTTRENRSKGMALIGVAFGLGFILGPALGAVSAAKLGLAGPGWVAAVLCAGNFVLAWFILAESRQPSQAPATVRPSLAQWQHTLSQPRVGLLVMIYFLATFCFTCLEATLPLLVGSPLFHPDDFRDPRALAVKLTQGAEPVSAHLRRRLSPGFLASAGRVETARPAQLRGALFRECNDWIKGELLLDETLRQGLRLEPQMARLLKSSPRGDPLIRVNRRLLEAAYPKEIGPQRLYMNESRIGYLFAYCGLVSVLIQGGVIGRLVKRFGEGRLIYASLVMVAGSLVLVPYAPDLELGSLVWLPDWAPAKVAALARGLLDLAALLAGLALFSLGTATNRAPTMALISLYTPVAEQGAALGVAQSAGTLARIIGPVFATSAYAISPHSPYLIGAVLAAGAAWLAYWGLGRGAAELKPAAQTAAAGPA